MQILSDLDLDGLCWHCPVTNTAFWRKHSIQSLKQLTWSSPPLTYDDMWNVCWQVLQYCKGGHYQVACAKMFELIHGSLTGGEEEGEVSFQHPNQYFEESYKRLHKNLGKLFYLHKNLGKLFYLHRNLGKQFLYSGKFLWCGEGEKGRKIMIIKGNIYWMSVPCVSISAFCLEVPGTSLPRFIFCASWCSRVMPSVYQSKFFVVFLRASHFWHPATLSHVPTLPCLPWCSMFDLK